VSQSTLRRIRDQLQLLRHGEPLPFGDLLDRGLVRQALAAETVVFRECLFTPLITLWTFLAQVLSPDHSCREAVDRLLAYRTARGQKPCGSQTDTYCKARQRLPVGVVQRLVRQTADETEGRVPEPWLWKGRRVWLVDGSTVSMPDTPDNQRAFPQARTQATGVGFPLARVVALISLATGVLRDLALGPYQGKETGETALFRTLWGRLNRGEIVLGDRTFSSYFGIAPLVQRGVDGLFRMHQKRKYDFRRGHRLGITDHVVVWSKPERPDWMDEPTYAQVPAVLPVRELRVRVEQDGFRVDELVLVTTMLDPTADPKEELADLFRERWHIELDLRSIKCVMQMDVLRCKTAAMVEKEVWMHVLAYNLIRGLMAAAAETHGKSPRRLSFKGALQALGAFRDALGLSGPDHRGRLVEELLKALAASTVGDRFGRVEPRAIKRRPKPHKLLKEPRDRARKRLMRNA
jgi:Transposase DDE domain